MTHPRAKYLCKTGQKYFQYILVLTLRYMMFLQGLDPAKPHQEQTYTVFSH